MPSHPPDPGWAFSSVYNLLGSDCHDIGTPTLAAPALSPESPSTRQLTEGGGVGLGNFGKLYETLGWPDAAATAPLPPLDESELSNSDDVLLSPVLEASNQPVSQPDTQASDIEIIPAGLTKKQRRKARKAAEKARQDQVAETEESEHDTQSIKETNQSSQTTSVLFNLDDATNLSKRNQQTNLNTRVADPVSFSTTESAQVSRAHIAPRRPSPHKRTKSSNAPVTPKPRKETQLLQAPPGPAPLHFPAPVTPDPFHASASLQSRFQTPTTVVPGSHGLVPRTVLPATLPQQNNLTTVASKVPTTPCPTLLPPYSTPQATVVIRSQVDRHFNLLNKLLARFVNDRKWLVAPRQLINEETRADGIHIFVDASNILYGFKDMLRNFGIQPYDISFDSLALLMERRRPVAKRVFVGSHREANPLPQVKKLVETSKAVGYECNVQEQVYIVREESEKKKFFNDVKRLGWQRANQLRSGSGSDSETNAATPKVPSAPKWVEQGVDELLHLKMCQSIIDTEKPTTMVLATGDGAAAEMSDGFLAHVERAMRNGWNVELMTWRQQTNGGYKRRAFRQKWGEQFTIIELDDFLEDLIDTE